MALSALALLLSVAAHAASLQELDAILMKAGSVSEFLNRPELVNEYYRVASDYYGGEEAFPRKSYDAILKQLRTMSAAVPDLNKRLWETPAESHMGREIHVESNAKSFGRDVRPEAWAKKLEELRTQLKTSAGELLAAEATARIRESVEKQVQDLHASAEYQQAGKKAKGILDAAVMKKIRTRPDVRKWAAQLALQTFENPSVQLGLSNPTGDVILNTWDRLRVPSEGVPSVVASEARSLLPDTKVLVNDERLFLRSTVVTNRGKAVETGRSGAAAYDFKVLPRRFHGIFKGVRIKECVGGACEGLNSLTPERWATVALKDSQIHYLEQDHSFLGFIEAVPGRVGDKVYATVDFGAAELRNAVNQIDETGAVQRKPLFTYWIEGMREAVPSDWKGLLVSDKRHLNNAGVLNDIHGSMHSVKGEKLELGPWGFNIDDPLAKEMLAKMPQAGENAAKYGGNWILDATAKPDQPRTMTVLSWDTQVTDEITRQIQKELDSGDPIVWSRLAKSTFSHEDSLRIPGLKEKLTLLVEKGNEAVLESLAEHVFSKPHTVGMTDLLLAIVKKGSTRVNEAVAKYVISQPHAVELEKVIRVLIEQRDPSVLEILARDAFSKPHMAQMKDLWWLLMEKAGPSILYTLADSVFSEPHSVERFDNYRDVYRVIAENGSPGTLRALRRSGFARQPKELIETPENAPLYYALNFEDQARRAEFLESRLGASPRKLSFDNSPPPAPRRFEPVGQSAPQAQNPSVPEPPQVERLQAEIPSEPGRKFRTPGGNDLVLGEKISESEKYVVYRATDSNSRPVAVKIPKPGVSPAELRRMIGEERDGRIGLREQQIPANRLFEVSESLIVSDIPDGVRGDVWREQWRARGSSSADMALLGLKKILSDAERKNVDLKNFALDNLYWDGQKWIFTGATLDAKQMKFPINAGDFTVALRMGMTRLTCEEAFRRLMQ